MHLTICSNGSAYLQLATHRSPSCPHARGADSAQSPLARDTRDVRHLRCAAVILRSRRRAARKTKRPAASPLRAPSQAPCHPQPPLAGGAFFTGRRRTESRESSRATRQRGCRVRTWRIEATCAEQRFSISGGTTCLTLLVTCLTHVFFTICEPCSKCDGP